MGDPRVASPILRRPAQGWPCGIGPSGHNPRSRTNNARCYKRSKKSAAGERRPNNRGRKCAESFKLSERRESPPGRSRRSRVGGRPTPLRGRLGRAHRGPGGGGCSAARLHKHPTPPESSLCGMWDTLREDQAEGTSWNLQSMPRR